MQTSQYRPRLAAVQAQTVQSSNPQTPPRPASSFFSSPLGSYRLEEDAIVVELGCRTLVAGLATESTPRCRVEYASGTAYRHGDYRQWLPEWKPRKRAVKTYASWGKSQELWHSGSFNAEILDDMLGRVLRTALIRHLLVDIKARKLVLILPTLLPSSMLRQILSTFFDQLNPSNISLLTPALCSMVAAGCRSGLVVDVGWHETIITAIVDCREVCEARTARAMKLVTFLLSLKLDGKEVQSAAYDSIQSQETNTALHVVETLLDRYACCRLHDERNAGARVIPDADGLTDEDMAEIFEKALFDQSSEFDSHEKSIAWLAYRTLSAMSHDARSQCMNNVIISGDACRIPGIKSRIVQDIDALQRERFWSVVVGRAADKVRDRHQAVTGARHVRGLGTLGPWVGAALCTRLHIKSRFEFDREVLLPSNLPVRRDDRIMTDGARVAPRTVSLKLKDWG